MGLAGQYDLCRDIGAMWHSEIIALIYDTWHLVVSVFNIRNIKEEVWVLIHINLVMKM